MFAEIKAQLDGRLPPGWQATFEDRYRRAFEAELRPVDGVVEMLDRVSVPSCVASSSSPAQLRFSLGLVGLYERFEGRIFSATEVEHGKPAPDLFLYAASRMGALPERCVVIEDSVYGVQAARAAGMPVFAFAGGLIARELLDGPDTVLFDDMRALPELLGF
jgi:HAD superfamily hydrolase (TIGR01509 family)